MATNTVPAVVKNHIDTKANLTSDDITPLSGEMTIDSDTHRFKFGDGSTSYTSLPYANQGLPLSFNIASANTVIALPPITGKVQRQRYYWIGGDGSNTFSFTVSDGSTIGGIAATLWIGEGDGYIDIESDGVSDWKVVYYSDSGSNSNGDWCKQSNGILTQTRIDTVALVTSSAVSPLANNSRSYTYPIPFLNTDIVFSNGALFIGGRVWGGMESNVTTTTFTFFLMGLGTSDSGFPRWKTTGRWRT